MHLGDVLISEEDGEEAVHVGGEVQVPSGVGIAGEHGGGDDRLRVLSTNRRGEEREGGGGAVGGEGRGGGGAEQRYLHAGDCDRLPVPGDDVINGLPRRNAVVDGCLGNAGDHVHLIPRSQRGDGRGGAEERRCGV